ncbi:4-(cytidine 5'-diphospho)-2-C-methyl-D-erythritol kinase [Kitasatospora sp. NPDC086801]|uniref:4-(cytidine 5'-diphospho)-2-C-methyl-D-erythritol kinase n=1 Tax=Kitasatospora sp. NPDC086801 TaxID=3364066 RepID=UPI003827E59E
MNTATPPTPRSVTATAPGKINVQLSVGARRPDGYHALTTVFLAVALHDTVTATLAAPGRTAVTVIGTDAQRVPTDATNLAVRAAQLLREHHGTDAGVALHITKRIPVAGGMAGGSADAAATLLACDALWNTRTPPAQLHALASELGSDVPFALLGHAALGQGRGEILADLPVIGPLHWVLAFAHSELATPAVYAEHDRLHALRPTDARPRPQPPADPALLAALKTGDATALGAALVNDLQTAALSLHPALAATLRIGAAAGALGSIVSGSGPTCAFLTTDTRAAQSVARALAASRAVRRVRTVDGPAQGAHLVPPRTRPTSGRT